MTTLLLWALTPSLAAAPLPPSSFCSPRWETLPIQRRGRTKPLFVHARETLKFLTGTPTPQKQNPVTTYCQMSLEGLGFPPLFDLQTPLHRAVQKALSLPESQTSLPYSRLKAKREFLQNLVAQLEEGVPEKKPLQKLLSQIHLHERITSSQDWVIPTFTSGVLRWVSLKDLAPQAASLSSILEKNALRFEREKGSKHRLEYVFAKSQWAKIALGLTFSALMALFLFPQRRWGRGLAALSLLVQLAGISLRVVISGRAPITNMYETVLFSGFAALALALIIGFLKRDKIFLALGLATNLAPLTLMATATDMLSDSIHPLVPVLRDNFWLSTHVTTVVASYGALALSWILANTVLIRQRFKPLSASEWARYAHLTTSCLKWGTVLLGAGIILGGVWADYSWGRFWGWDPKETWGLIAFCLYMAILHGRRTNWIPPHRFMAVTALAFLSVMMAWFGVNYILASGLHSYGFSEGGAVFLSSFFALQISLVALTMRSRALSTG